MHVVIFWPREYKSRYRTSTGVDSVDVRWWNVDFPAKRIPKQISHIDWCRLGRCAMMQCCDFLAKIIQKQLSHIDWCRLGRCAMMQCCDFLAKIIQKQLSHIDWRRLGRCATMHVLLFWPRAYTNTKTDIAHRLVSTRSMCDGEMSKIFEGRANIRERIFKALFKRT